mmetsp:Transcript_12500/g.37550  ORF Transcript_12500/g.37550 Transcript_12500/m.37550 type:complete len:1432 (+) Transcript_12500:1172-5467(+)
MCPRKSSSTASPTLLLSLLLCGPGGGRAQCSTSVECGDNGSCVDGKDGRFCSYVRTPSKDSRFRYIVVGGGAAGCSSAATLAETGATLLIERGDEKEVYPSLHNFETWTAQFVGSSFDDFVLTTENFRATIPKVLGGGTSINAGIYNRDKSQTDSAAVFAQLGLDAAEINEAYTWIEEALQPEPASRPVPGSLASGLRSAAVIVGNMTNHSTPSINLVDGVFRPYTLLPGPDSLRSRSSADIFIRRPNLNLTVLTKSSVTRIIFDAQKRAVGVEYRNAASGNLHQAFVEDRDGEVVLAAGALSTPILLMASGIGPAVHLREHGVPVITDSPTVGTLTEPPALSAVVFGMRDEILNPRIAPALWHTEDGVTGEIFTDEKVIRGLFTSACGLVPRPDRTPSACKAAEPLYRTRTNLNQDLSSGAMITLKLSKPTSQGQVRLRSRSVSDGPQITFDFFTSPDDLTNLSKALKTLVEMFESDGLSNVRASRLPTMTSLAFGVGHPNATSPDGSGLRPFLPLDLPTSSSTDDVFEAWTRNNVVSMYHSSGTAAGAVDSNFSVIGVSGLRVVDASVLRYLPGTNPMASIMALGRYAGRAILNNSLNSNDEISPASFPLPSDDSHENNVGIIIGLVLLGIFIVVTLIAVVLYKQRYFSVRQATSHGSVGSVHHQSFLADEMALDASHLEMMRESDLKFREGRQARTGMILDSSLAFSQSNTTATSISLRDLSAFARAKDRKGVTAVLQNVNAFIRPARVTALVGPSGSGKSTLMNGLAFGNSFAHFDGNIMFAGEPVSKWRKTNRVGFVPQHSLFVPVLTTLEHLQYQASLRLPQMDAEERARTIRNVLSVVGLSRVQHIKCGGTLAGGYVIKGLSGGQQRLLSIATVLLEGNGVMMLDEPTSGLDSHHAYTVMLCLRILAAKGHTIVVTIHQPSTELWDMVDDAIVLSCGRPIFSGDTAEMVPWMETHGFAKVADENPLDFVMDLITVGVDKPVLLYGEHTFRTAEDIGILAVNFRHTHIASQRWRSIQDYVRTGRWRTRAHNACKEDETDAEVVKWRVPWHRQVAILCYRQLQLTVKNPGDALARLFTYTAIGILTGIVYSANNLADTWMSFVLFLTNTIFLLPFATLTLHTVGKAGFMTESPEGLTHTSAYCVAMSIVESIVSGAAGFAFIVPVYFIVPLTGDFGCFTAATFLSTLVMATFLRLATIMSPTQDMTFVFGSGVIAYAMLFGGILVPFSELPSWLEPLQWTSFLRYASGYYAQCELPGQTYDVVTITDDQAGVDLNASLGGVYGLIQAAIPTTTTGDAMLAYYEYDTLTTSQYAGAMLGITVLLMVMLFGAHEVVARSLVKQGNLEKQFPEQLAEAIAAAAAEIGSDAYREWKQTTGKDGGLYSPGAPKKSGVTAPTGVLRQGVLVNPVHVPMPGTIGQPSEFFGFG